MFPKSWEEIRSYCLSTGSLFEDAAFPAKDTSAFVTMKPTVPFEWKRPSELVVDPCLFVGGASHHDICQGELGDCWLLAGLSGLTQHPSLLRRVIPEGQSFGDGYFGAFRFNFWREGNWTEVIVDDRLPTYRCRLVFTHSAEINEFWVALLEKAYAKLHGSYEALAGGHANEAMEDFTGGIGQSFNLKDTSEDLFGTLHSSLNHLTLISCSIDARPDDLEDIDVFGLVKGHAYSVTGVQKVELEPSEGNIQQVKLVRLKNPWSNEHMWRGAWSDGSVEWKSVPASERRRIDLCIIDDGEFWMTFEDFVKHFDRLEMCLLEPCSLETSAGKTGKTWEMYQDCGDWRRDSTAGGCRKYLATFTRNPQFRFDVKRPAASEDADVTRYVVVALMQKGRRKMSTKAKIEMLAIGFAIYKAEESDLKNGKLDADFFASHRATARSKSFSNRRTVTGQFHLPAGSYWVIPSTFYPDEEGGFNLRILVEKAADESETQSTHYVTNLEEPMKESYLDTFQLQEVLSGLLRRALGDEPLPLEVCRSFIALQDRGITGRVSRNQLKTIMELIIKWKNAFNKFAQSGWTLEVDKLHSALAATGVDYVSEGCIFAITAYFTSGKDMDFITFLLVMARLCALHNVFCSGSRSKHSLDEFLRQTIGL